MILRKLIRAIIDYLSRYVRPTNEELVRHIILGTMGLELMRHEYVEFAPIRGTCGNFKVTGNGLPWFRYLIFDRQLMEFVRVEVSVLKPDKIEFNSRIEGTDASTHGKPVETKEKYKEPFMKLATHLHSYFPLNVQRGIRAVPENRYIEKPMTEEGLGEIHQQPKVMPISDGVNYVELAPGSSNVSWKDVSV